MFKRRKRFEWSQNQTFYLKNEIELLLKNCNPCLIFELINNAVFRH